MRRRDELLVGLLLIVAVTVGILGTIWLVRGGFAGGYPLFARFEWGAGLRQGQPVLLAGVNVGYVSNVRLEADGTLLTRLSIEDQYGIPQGSTATVIPIGIFGDVAVALTPPGPSRTYYARGDTVPTGAGAPSTGELLARADTIERNVRAVTVELEQQLVNEGGLADLRRALANTNQLVVQSNALIRQLSGIATQQSAALSSTIADARRSVAAIDSAAIDSTVRHFRQTSANVEALTADLRSTTMQLDSVLAQLRGTDGTAGLLLNDPGLYNDLRRLTTRIDSLTLDFQRNPRRYINLSIF